MRKILPVFLALIGLVAGIGAGLFLRPAPALDEQSVVAEPLPTHQSEYVKLNNQFIIPVVEGGRVASMVIMALSLEVTPGSTEAIYAREPKLRGALLQVMFDHANAGGFRGSFTDGVNLMLLRKALLEAAQSVMGSVVSDVLIADIARQDS
ncbi:MAG: flagellar basal body-associated FliL family protein [Pseudorhodobacter sp.]|nr:flagellar basal body-associated FliL family protein [Pseudorhodobacter sp.]